MLEFFENHDAGAFADHKTVAPLIPRTTRLFGLIVTRGESTHGCEPADAHGRDRRFRAASDHHVGVVVLNDAEGISNGVRAGGAGSCRRFVWPLGSETH